MSSKNRIGASLLAAALIALSIYAVPAAFAKSSSGVSLLPAAADAATETGKYAVTLALSKTEMFVNDTVKFRGTVLTAAGKTASGTVTIQKRRASGGSWVNWRTDRLNSSGVYSKSVKMTGQQTWEFRAKMPGNSANSSGYSPLRGLEVVRGLYDATINLSKTEMFVNDTVKFRGTVLTAAGKTASGTVTIQKRRASGGSWVNWRTDRLNSSGVYSKSVKMTGQQTWEFRAKMPGNSANSSGYTATRGLEVRVPTPTPTPTPIPTPTVTPIPTPTPTPIPTPTVTPTPTPTPTPTIVNVMDYGATGNGTTDDTAAIKRAMTAAASSVKKVYLPAGTYAVSPITPPDGLTILGASKDSTWLKGHLDFGSNQTISDLKIGDAGNSAVYNVNGATNTTFERIHFRGGGGDRNSVIDMGGWNSCSHITFKDSEVERNLGSDPSFLNGYNNITIWEGHGSHMESILFEGVTVGVSNGAAGQNTGSPRMGLEAYVNSDSLTTTGFRDITIRNSTFEAADGETIDFSDQVGARASGILIEGNTIKGGGVTKVKWGYGLNLEVPTGVVVRNNYFTRAWMQTLNMTNRGDAFTAPGTVITGNTFDLTTGVTPLGEHPIRLWGDDNIFTGNTIIGGWDATLVALYASHRNSVTANTFRSTSNPIREYDGSSGNTLTPNVVQ